MNRSVGKIVNDNVGNTVSVLSTFHSSVLSIRSAGSFIETILSRAKYCLLIYFIWRQVPQDFSWPIIQAIFYEFNSLSGHSLKGAAFFNILPN